MIINQYKKRLLQGTAIVLIFILSSCSKQVGSISHLRILNNQQVLTDNVKTENLPTKEVNKSAVQPIATKAPPTQTNPKENYSKPEHNQKPYHNFFQISKKGFSKVIQKQTTAIRNLYPEKHISSYLKASDDGGFLGLAILCFIAAVVLAYFGYVSLAGLLWVIGIICLAAAILFFILWLLSRAVDAD